MPQPNLRPSQTVLIVEGNPGVRKLFRVALKSEGFFVKEAGTAAEALKLVREASPDLVIQDLMIPGMDGIQLALDYRKLPGAEKIPVIAVSGLQPGLVLAKAVKSGFVDYLPKPIELTKLVEVVRAHLPVAKIPNTSGRKLEVIVADDNPLQLKLIRAFLEGSGFKFHDAKDGLEAVAMARKLKPNAIVSDVFMPHLDGFGVCKSVRLDPTISKIPIILYSSVLDDPADHAFAKLSGVDAFVTKGQAEYLVAELERLLDRPEPLPIGQQHLQTVESGAEAPRQADLQAELNVRLVRRLGVQEIEMAILSQVLRLSTTARLRAFPQTVLENCLSAGQVSAAAIFLRRAWGKIQLSTAFGFHKGPGTLKTFYGHADIIKAVIRYNEAFGARSQQPLPPTLAKLLAALGPRVLVIPVTIEKRKLGALVAVSADNDDDYFERFMHLVSRNIALAINFIEKRNGIATKKRNSRTAS